MKADVYWKDTVVGKITGETDAFGINIDIHCNFLSNYSEQLYRCYAVKLGYMPILIGLLEPVESELYFSKHFSKETIKKTFRDNWMQEKFILSTDKTFAEEIYMDANENKFVAEQERIDIGDKIINRIISENHIKVTQTDNGFILKHEFLINKPFLLAPAFVLCKVENGEVILEIKKKH